MSANTIDSLDNAEGMATSDIDSDGRTDAIVSDGENGSVYWYQQPDRLDNSWTQTTIQSGFSEVEGVATGDFDDDGNIEVVIADQGGDELAIAKQDTSDPTGSWSATTLDAGATNVQGILIWDVDSDGNLDIMYSYEGSASGNGGIFWQQFGGGDPLDSNNWTQHQALQVEGAWWLAQRAPKDLTADGNSDDVLFSVRESKNTAASGEVAYISPPSDPTNTWSKTQIDDNADYVPLHVSHGNLFGNNHEKDILASAFDSGNSIYRYDFSNGFARATVDSSTRYYNSKARDLSSNSRDDLFVNDDGSSEFKLYVYDGSQYVVTDSIAHGKSDSAILAADITGDGTNELLTTSSGSENEVSWFEFDE